MSLLTIDDRDSAITYTGDWYQQGNPDTEHEGTTTVTYSAGATARVSFTGTGISVFGTIGPAYGYIPITSFTIEGDSSTQEIFVAEPKVEIQYRVQFYEIKNLAHGPHVLVITFEGSNAELFLDFFNIVGEDERPSPIVPSGVSRSPLSSLTASIASGISSSSPTSSRDTSPDLDSTPGAGRNSISTPTSILRTPLIPLPASSGNSAPLFSAGADATTGSTAASSRPAIGPIVGGVVGGLAIISFLVLGIVFLRGRRRRRRDSGYVIDPPPRFVTPSALPGVYGPLSGGSPLATHQFPSEKRRPSSDLMDISVGSSPLSSETVPREVPPPRYEV